MSEKTKVLYIIDSFNSPYAGTEGQLFKLIQHLDPLEFETHLILFNRSDFIESNNFPCPVTTLGASKLSSPRTWWRLFKALRKKRAQGFRLAHIFFNDPSIIAPPLLQLLGYRTLISRRDMGYWYTPNYLRLLRINSKLVDGVIVNSEAVKQITCEKEGYDNTQVEVIYNGYEEKSVNVSRQIDFRKSQDELVLGIVANIRPIKRMGDAIDALKRLVEIGLKARLVIVGGGDPLSLRARADELGVQDMLVIAGAQSQPSDYIQGFDICLLCSESEGFSNAIVEYMQFSKPVVCSAVGGNPECIQHGVSGFLYPAGDVTELVECLKPLFENKELRKTIGIAASNRVKDYYSMDRMINLHSLKYKALMLATKV